MAVSSIANDMRGGGVQLTCILEEGAITVNSNVMGPDGYFDTGYTFGSPLQKDDWVMLDVQSNNTYDATYGLPVVKNLTAATGTIGQIVSEPRMAGPIPANSAAADTYAERLAGKYFRVATVWFPGVIGVTKANIVTTDTAAVTPGAPALLNVDASASLALRGGVTTLSLVDVASGGSGIISFHYVAKQSAATFSILVGFVGGPSVVGT